MKILIISLVVLLVSLLDVVLYAAPTTNTKNPQKIEFDDLLVQGKYQVSDEAVTTVEQDKVLDALLGVRKDFRDRLVQSSDRN